jgi:hypothetical protein
MGPVKYTGYSQTTSKQKMKSTDILFTLILHTKLQIIECVITKLLQENFFLNREEENGGDFKVPPPPFQCPLNTNILESVRHSVPRKYV